MAQRGVERYHHVTAQAEQQGRGSETSYAQRLMPEYIDMLADAIEAAKSKNTGGRPHTCKALLKGADAQQVAFITLRYIFDSLVTGATANTLAMNIGRRVEDQIRFSLFELDNKGYYSEVLRDFKRKGTVNYQHMHKVLTVKANEMHDNWTSWTTEERVLLGAKLLEMSIEVTGLFVKDTFRVGAKRVEVRVLAAPSTLDWINEHKANAEILRPEIMPCVVPPCDWTSINDGGYFTPEIRNRVEFIKIKSKAHRAAVQHLDFSTAMQSVNKIQQTAWAVNTQVHDVMKEVWRLNLRIGMPASEPIPFPESPVARDLKKEGMNEEQLDKFMLWKKQVAKMHTNERERFSKCLQLSRVFQMAEKFRAYKEFYYVYNCDFRGRIYCASPGLSPQGADFSKGLLCFAHGKPLGNAGAYWLAVHGANTYGYDKASYDDRREWVEQNTDAILACAAAPLDGAARSFWSDADKPWQFLAFCFEWAKYKAVGDAFESRLAVALDGSCNGLQNFSAMLRDEIGAAATNLQPADKPEDIYQRVADVCLDKLRAILAAPELQGELQDVEIDLLKRKCAAQWLSFGITRKCSKRPVMTLPYGSTRQSCREYIEDYILENAARSPWESHRDIFDASLFLSGVMWASIGQVVLAAREAMDWLQKISRVLSGENIPLHWSTPSGFHVYQGTMINQRQVIRTQLCGTCQLSMAHPTSEVDARKQSLGIAPNFVHSMDASHLVLTVQEGTAIEAWAMIHDSYGTYAADTDRLHGSIRRAFVQMYMQHDVIQEFKQAADDALNARYATASEKDQSRLELLELPAAPRSGAFQLESVLEAKYFFG